MQKNKFLGLESLSPPGPNYRLPISDKMGHSTEMFRAYKWVKSGAKGELDLGEEV